MSSRSRFVRPTARYALRVTRGRAVLLFFRGVCVRRGACGACGVRAITERPARAQPECAVGCASLIPLPQAFVLQKIKHLSAAFQESETQHTTCLISLKCVIYFDTIKNLFLRLTAAYNILNVVYGFQ